MRFVVDGGMVWFTGRWTKHWSESAQSGPLCPNWTTVWSRFSDKAHSKPPSLTSDFSMLSDLEILLHDSVILITEVILSMASTVSPASRITPHRLACHTVPALQS